MHQQRTRTLSISPAKHGIGPTNSDGMTFLFAYPGDTLALEAQEFDFLDALDNAWQRERVTTANCELPFHGGWFVYLGYELAAQIEPSLQLGNDRLLPTAHSRFAALQQ